MSFRVGLNKFYQTSSSLLFQRRFASASSVTSAASGVAQRLQGVAQPLVYYGRVGFEFVSQVASHQRLLAFPDIGKGIEGITNFIRAFSTGAWKTVTVGDVGKLGIEGIKIYGLFLVGEIIGRGSFIGYNIKGSGHDHGHH